MTDKNYNELLRKRVLQENREFNEELEKLPAHEALSRAYEKVIKEDLVCSISEGNLTNTEARASACCFSSYRHTRAALPHICLRWFQQLLKTVNLLL